MLESKNTVYCLNVVVLAAAQDRFYSFPCQHTEIDKSGFMLMTCKNANCGFKGDAKVYVGFWPSERIRDAHNQDPIMPKYGYHLGIDCPKCGTWQQWLPQTDEAMLMEKFYPAKETSSYGNAL